MRRLFEGSRPLSPNASCIACPCGTRYERVDVRLPIKDIGIFECHYCGESLAHWQGKVVPKFTLISTPRPKSSNAA